MLKISNNFYLGYDYAYRHSIRIKKKLIETIPPH